MFRLNTFIFCTFFFLVVQSCKTAGLKDENGLPNIILIVSEDHGQDLGCYGNNVVKTPNIDFLANNGILFQNAYTTYSVCSPSRSSIITGLYPHQNGQIGLATHGYRMYDGIKTLPKYLKEAGYWSGCIGKVHVNPESEIPWDYRPGGLIDGSNFGKKSMPEYAGKAMEFIRQAEGKPFFLMVNYPDAHFPIQRQVEGMPQNPLGVESVDHTLPFVGANTERLREITADYYNCINRLDEAMGMLLDSIRANGMLNHSFIIFLSDHGAQFSRGKTTNYEGALKIPLMMYWPQKIMGGIIEENKLVSTVDLLPTILDAIGEKPLPEEFPGRSLLGIAQGRDEKNWREYLFADGIGCTAEYFFPRRSVRGERYKLIYNIHSGKEDPYYNVYTDHIYPQVVSGTSRDEILTLDKSLQEVYSRWESPPKFELYDLLLDPWEYNDLAPDPVYKEELEKMKEVLFAWQKKSSDPIYEPEYLRMIELEVDSIKKHYPNHSYQKDPNFQWKYPEYFGDFVRKKTFSKK